MKTYVELNKNLIARSFNDLESDIKERLAQHYFVKYYWELDDIDMSKQYQECSLEDYRVRQNKSIIKVKSLDDETIFINTVKEVCSEYGYLAFANQFILLDIDTDSDVLPYLFTEVDNNEIEDKFISKINYQDIVEYVRTHTEEEVIDKYLVNKDEREDFFFHYV